MDDCNVQRFINLLEHYKTKTQFIIVTHNKKTMQAADMLLGVSMQEKGVTSLFSMDLEQEDCVLPQLV